MMHDAVALLIAIYVVSAYIMRICRSMYMLYMLLLVRYIYWSMNALPS